MSPLGAGIHYTYRQSATCPQCSPTQLTSTPCQRAACDVIGSGSPLAIYGSFFFNDHPGWLKKTDPISLPTHLRLMRESYSLHHCFLTSGTPSLSEYTDQSCSMIEWKFYNIPAREKLIVRSTSLLRKWPYCSWPGQILIHRRAGFILQENCMKIEKI